MDKLTPKYELLFRWGNFRLNIVGRKSILWWAGGFCLLVGLQSRGTRLLELPLPLQY